MFKNIENFKIESIHAGVTKKSASVLCRNGSSLILRTSGAIRYTFPDCFFDIHPGKIVFLPQGSRYDVALLTDTPSHYVSIKFEGELYEKTPFVYSIDSFPDAAELANKLPDMWKFGSLAERYRCYAVVYNLLAYLKNLEKFTYADKKKYSIISPAVSYLEKHIYDSDLKIETLIELCGVSGAYFHKIFRVNYAMSPQKYILSKRLSQAKLIIDTGDFDKISEVARAVGYHDPLYFSRAFKKKYGVSPLHYAKQNTTYNEL